MRHLVLLYALLTAACEPGVCGTVEIRGIAANPVIDDYRNAEGNVELYELCSSDHGATAHDRPDYMFTTLVLTGDPPELFSDDDVFGIVLGTASVVFLNEHLVTGTVIPFSQLAGSGLHKSSEGATYNTYALTAGTVTIVKGPHDREVSSIDEDVWTDKLKIKWDLEFGANGLQHWIGEDTVTRHDGDTIGSPVHIPPDYQRP